MRIIELEIPGPKLIEPMVFADERGFFLESYRKNSYGDHGIDCAFVQDNRSSSRKGALRGMHFQSRPGQAKLISVIQGKIFDVIVDIRPDSPHFGRWVGTYLDSQTHRQLFVPVGFAHGFYTISDTADVYYKVSHVYDPMTEKNFRFDDPDLNIKWPGSDFIISQRDLAAPLFKEVFP